MKHHIRLRTLAVAHGTPLKSTESSILEASRTPPLSVQLSLRLGEIASQPHQAKDEGLPIERLAGRNTERLVGRNAHKQLKNKDIDNPPIENPWRKAKGLSNSEATAPP